MMEALLSSVSLLALKAFFPLALAPGLRRRGSGHQIARSLRFNSADSANLSWTPGGAGDRKLLCRRVRIKRCKLGAAQVIFSAGTTSIDKFYFDSSDRLCLDVLGTTRLVTTRVFRDPNAWLDVGFELDVANGTAASRAKILIEEAEATAYSTDSRSSIANSDTNWNNTVVQYIGRDNGGNYFDGYMAEPAGANATVAITYSALDSETGIRLPAGPSATWGTNGFYLDFSDNSNTTAATLGADRSGNGNDWTPNNFSVAAGVGNDSLVDTPTNYGTDTGAGGEVRGNYATWNPLNAKEVATFSNGNLDVAFSTASARGARTTMYFESGKWVAEMTAIGAAGVEGFGVIAEDGVFSGGGVDIGCVYFINGRRYLNGVDSGVAFATLSAADIMRIELDMDASPPTIQAFKNGTTQFTSNLTSGKKYAFGGVSYSNSIAAVSFNFGQRPFAGTPTTGFKACCTQNRPDPAIKKLSNGFVQAQAAHTSIQSDLATLRAGWSSYVEIFKRTDGTEGWRWRFSDDTGNYLDSSSQAAKTTFPALSGTYMGYAIRCDSSYPARTGTVSHTNGAASTVTHNLGNARCLIIVKNEGAGSTDWFVYHPDLTAGNLLKMNATGAEASGTTITSVGANSFQIGSGTATGTYRYIVIVETEGFFDLGSYTGNASAAGPAEWKGLRPAWSMFNRYAGGTCNWISWDSIRTPHNVGNQELYLDATAASTGAGANRYFDFVASGLKIRGTGDSYINASAGKHVTATFGTPFKYARAA